MGVWCLVANYCRSLFKVLFVTYHNFTNHCLQCLRLQPLTLLIGWQEGHLACKRTEWWDAPVAMCLGQGADLHIAQLMPLPLTISCSSKPRLVLPFWYWLTWVVLDKGLLNGCCWYTNRAFDSGCASLVSYCCQPWHSKMWTFGWVITTLSVLAQVYWLEVRVHGLHWV